MSDFAVIERDEVKSHESRWGNNYLTISDEDIADLRAGKVLYHYDGEYGTFITLEENER